MVAVLGKEAPHSGKKAPQIGLSDFGKSRLGAALPLYDVASQVSPKKSVNRVWKRRRRAWTEKLPIIFCHAVVLGALLRLPPLGRILSRASTLLGLG
ncbi:hypothetical protein HK16_07210 [Acetobacter senegalensis]|uniref:Uncharacterized protein n=2 Tax=Acetobacter TaxID=434 RepID=A0A252EK51_9PROT|nr:hypothetical protein CIW82_12150 [Acetobacter tropicalis]OUL66769.1 hypothetical protein HK16_07210 [Acetobacter senegalensis]